AGDRCADAHDLIGRQRLAFDLLLKWRALYILHSDETQTLAFADLVNVRDVGALDFRGCAVLMHKAAGALRVGGNRGWYSLELGQIVGRDIIFSRLQLVESGERLVALP